MERPTFAHMNRIDCRPAPTISLQSLKAISRLKLEATAPRMPVTLAETSVQKNARHPIGSSPRTIRIAPPACRHFAMNVCLAATPGGSFLQTYNRANSGRATTSQSGRRTTIARTTKAWP